MWATNYTKNEAIVALVASLRNVGVDADRARILAEKWIGHGVTQVMGRKRFDPAMAFDAIPEAVIWPNGVTLQGRSVSA